MAVAAIAAPLLLSASPAAASDRVGALWPLDEGRGQQVRDVSGNANHGTLGPTTAFESSDPTWVALPRSRWYQPYALRFDGDDLVQVGDNATLERDEIVVGARVRATSPGTYRYVLSKGALRCETASYGLYTGASGGLSFYISNGLSFELSPDAGQAVWDGRWHWVFGTFKGGVVRLYVDGQEIGTGTATTLSPAYALSPIDGLQLGKYSGDCGGVGTGFTGDIDVAGMGGNPQAPSG